VRLLLPFGGSFGVRIRPAPGGRTACSECSHGDVRLNRPLRGGIGPAGGAPTQLRLWVALYTLSAGFLVGMEWLFFATQPSFLNVLSLAGQARVVGATLLPVIAGGAVLLLIFSAAARTPLWPVRVFCRASSRALPTLVLSASAVLLVDNFTTTVLGWGIASLQRGRLAYAAAVLVGVSVIWWEMGRWIAALRSNDRSSRIAGAFACAVIVIAGTGASLEIVHAGPRQQSAGHPASRPNLLLLGIDGVNADHLSLYGYARPTTPSLVEFSRDALVFTNAFTNAGNTGGALTAILTGRLPTDTRVIFAPDILRGEASVLHLPGLLRAIGYRTGQFAVSHYAASTDFNLRGGFHVVNGRAADIESATSKSLQALGLGGYFLNQIAERIRVRVEALAGRHEHSAFGEVTQASAAQYMDGERIRQLTTFVSGSTEPWFAHAHLLVTHGGRFAPRVRHFSLGKEQVTDWMPDFYDDAILEADASIGSILELLEHRGLLDRTLVIVYSDHGQGSRTERPVPLVLRLPHRVRHGRVGQTVQSIDIAPTIVDALGLRPPPWMAGRSLLRAIPPCRPVFGAVATSRVQNIRGDYTIPAPPFFSLGALSLVQGKQWFRLELDQQKPFMSGGVIPLLPGALAECESLVGSAAEALIVEHLASRGYDVSELRHAIR
jgi:arylsulfatase A-like enzyme